MKGPPLGPGREDIIWPDQVPPRGRRAPSTRKIKPQTSNLFVLWASCCQALRVLLFLFLVCCAVLLGRCALCRVSGRVVLLRCSPCGVLSCLGLRCRVLCCAVSLGAVLRGVAACRPARRCAVFVPCCVFSLVSCRCLLCCALGHCPSPRGPLLSGAVFCGFPPPCNHVKAKATSGTTVLESVPTFEPLDRKGSVEVHDFGVGSQKHRTFRLAQGINVPKITKSAFNDHCVEYHLPFLTETESEL